MKQVARSMAQETWDKMQDTRESLAFVQAFLAETQPVLNDKAQDQTSPAQIMERAADPGADLSTDVLRRVITRVREACLA
jgi:hypothetical protein